MIAKTALLVLCASLAYVSAGDSAAPKTPAAAAAPFDPLDIVFDLIDSNDDQKISKEEAEKFYTAVLGSKPTVDAEFAKADKDKDGFLTKAEFKEYAKANKITPKLEGDPADHIFDIIDSNDDQKISKEEAEKFFALINVPKNLVEASFAKADTDKDGFISKAEFKKQYEAAAKEKAAPPKPAGGY